MFMEVAIAAIGIGVVLMVGYLIVSSVRTSLPTVQMTVPNPCYHHRLNDTTYCNVTTYADTTYGNIPGPLSDNTSTYVSATNTNVATGMSSVQLTVFAGFALLAVGIIVLAAFGLINVFRQ